MALNLPNPFETFDPEALSESSDEITIQCWGGGLSKAANAECKTVWEYVLYGDPLRPSTIGQRYVEMIRSKPEWDRRFTEREKEIVLNWHPGELEDVARAVVTAFHRYPKVQPGMTKIRIPPGTDAGVCIYTFPISKTVIRVRALFLHPEFELTPRP